LKTSKCSSGVIEEGKTMQWPIEKEQKDQQWFRTHYTNKNKSEPHN